MRTTLPCRYAWRPPHRSAYSCEPAARRATLRSQHGPTSSGLRANPFPEVTDPFCRLPLSTLFYQLEAANLGDLMRLSVRPATKFIRSLRFSRVVASAPDTTKTAVLSQLVHPIASQSASRAHNGFVIAVKKKRHLFPGLAPTSLSSFALPLPTGNSTCAPSPAQPVCWLRNINLIPFRSAET